MSLDCNRAHYATCIQIEAIMQTGASIFQSVTFAELIDRLTRYYVLRIGLSNDVYWPV